MATITTCDLCGRQISPDEGRISVTVIDHTPLRRVFEDGGKRAKPPEPLHAQMDLHRACYVEQVLPALAPPPEA